MNSPVVIEEMPSNSWRGSGMVLLIDDDETVRAIGRKMLEQAGFRVVTGFDGEDGLEKFLEHCAQIRLILLDLTMPRLSGEETFRALKKIRGDIPVILLSGYSEHEITPRFEGKGLAGFLQKPFNTEQFLQKIEQALANEPEPVPAAVS